MTLYYHSYNQLLYFLQALRSSAVAIATATYAVETFSAFRRPSNGPSEPSNTSSTWIVVGSSTVGRRTLEEQPRRRRTLAERRHPPSAPRRATPPPSFSRRATPPPSALSPTDRDDVRPSPSDPAAAPSSRSDPAAVRPQQGIALSHLDAPLNVRSRLPLCLPLPASSAGG